jgi:hypothetical protein
MIYKLIVAFCFASYLTAPVIAQQIESHSTREINFVFEVKQIDEFFERFNNIETSLFSSYLNLKYPGFSRDRYAMLTTLFDKQDRTEADNLVTAFCQQVADTLNPAYLDFYNNDWYAEAVCKFLFRGAPIEVKLILKIQTTANGGSKWMIMGAYSGVFASSDKSPVIPGKPDCCKFLNPMSHATNFISLSRAFNDKMNVSDYLDSGFFTFASSKAFLRELLRDQLKYQYVKEIRYHFLQVPGWVFTVNQYRRKGVHSGWLISSLTRANDDEKQLYRERLLIKSRH